MEKIFIISMYQGNEKNAHQFHFIGHYKGFKVRKIMVKGGEFKKNRAYVLALIKIKINGDTLWGECVKYKELLN